MQDQGEGRSGRHRVRGAIDPGRKRRPAGGNTTRPKLPPLAACKKCSHIRHCGTRLRGARGGKKIKMEECGKPLDLVAFFPWPWLSCLPAPRCERIRSFSRTAGAFLRSA